VLKRFVDKGLLGREAAEGIPAWQAGWPHSGFEVNDEVAVAEAERAGQLRLARYCARNPVALERLDEDSGVHPGARGDPAAAGSCGIGSRFRGRRDERAGPWAHGPPPGCPAVA